MTSAALRFPTALGVGAGASVTFASVVVAAAGSCSVSPSRAAAVGVTTALVRGVLVLAAAGTWLGMSARVCCGVAATPSVFAALTGDGWRGVVELPSAAVGMATAIALLLNAGVPDTLALDELVLRGA